jgi:Family of unknown function (DUF5723)
MKMRFKMLLLLLTAALSGNVTAQTSQALYYMNLPQRNSLNPALQYTGRTFLGLPVISDISVRVDNNFLGISDMFPNGVISDSTIVFLEPGEDLDNFLAGLGANNSLELQAGVQLFGLSFTVGSDLRITLDVTERFDANLVMPRDLLRLYIGGNDSFMGQTMDLSSLRADAKYYHEIGIGASKNITEKLRVGARVLVLSGVASAYLTNNGITLTVNDDFTHSADAHASLNVSAPMKFIKDEEGLIDKVRWDEDLFNETSAAISYFLAMANPGLGFEAGAEYRFNDMFAVSAAITDFGFIKWKRDRSEVNITKTIQFNGLTMEDVRDESITFQELKNWTSDSIQTSIELSENPGVYITYLPFTATAGFSFTPVKFFTAGVLSQTRFIGKQVHEAFTISGNLHPGNFFSTTVAYTAVNRRYDNLGFGIALRGGCGQFFALIDNVPVKWTKMTVGSDNIKLPVNMNTVQVRLGFNLVFGNRDKEEMLPGM